MGKVELKIEIDESLVEAARDAGISVTLAMQEGLQRAIARAQASGMEERAAQWAEDNADAIKAYNERIARRGTFGEDLRRW